jgi:hypothetical protein
MINKGDMNTLYNFNKASLWVKSIVMAGVILVSLIFTPNAMAESGFGLGPGLLKTSSANDPSGYLTSVYTKYRYFIHVDGAYIDLTPVNGSLDVIVTFSSEATVINTSVSFIDGEGFIPVILNAASSNVLIYVSIPQMEETMMIPVPIIANPNNSSAALDYPTAKPSSRLTIGAGDAFNVRLSNVKGFTGSKIADGNYRLDIYSKTSNTPDKLIFSGTVLFTKQIATITIPNDMVTTVGIHTLTVDIPEINYWQEFTARPLTVEPGSAYGITVIQQPAGGAGSYDGLPANISSQDVRVGVIDKYGNAITTTSTGTIISTLVKINPEVSEAVLSGPGTQGVSVTNGEAVFAPGSLRIDKTSGTYRIHFTWAGSGLTPQPTVLSQVFQMTNMENPGLFVSLNPSTSLFLGLLSQGYNPTAANGSVTVTNTGSIALDNTTTITLTGDNSSDFILSSTAPISGSTLVATNETFSFSVQPRAGLTGFGEYQASVVVQPNGQSFAQAALPITFVVDDLMWNGSSGTQWTQAANWQAANYTGTFTATVPGANSNVIVAAAARNPIISSTVTIPNLTISNGGVLTVDPTGQLTVTGIAASDNPSKLIVRSASASSTGSVIINNAGVQATVERWIKGGTSSQYLELISSPVIGQGIAAFLAEADNGIMYNSSQNIYAIRQFNEFDNTWSNWGAYTDNVFVPGRSYIVYRNGDGLIRFRGQLPVSHTYSMTRTGTHWNAVGNPFSASVNVADFLNHNAAALDTTFQALYLYDYSQPSGSRYVTVNLLTGPENLSLGQGFFVLAAKEGVNTPIALDFTSVMRRHASPVFVKSMLLQQEVNEKNWLKLRLQASSSSNRASTLIAFHPDMSLGIDKGYDAGLLVSDAKFNLFTRQPLVGSASNLSVQALPDDFNTDMLIPVGLKVGATTEITFSVVYDGSVEVPVLFDKMYDIYTDLSSGQYKTTVMADEPETGRFFITMRAEVPGKSGDYALSTEDNSTMNWIAYAANEYIIIRGEMENNSKAFLIDITGRRLSSHHLSPGSFNRIPIAGLQSGIYFLQIIKNGHPETKKLYIR